MIFNLVFICSDFYNVFSINKAVPERQIVLHATHYLLRSSDSLTNQPTNQNHKPTNAIFHCLSLSTNQPPARHYDATEETIITPRYMLIVSPELNRSHTQPMNESCNRDGRKLIAYLLHMLFR